MEEKGNSFYNYCVEKADIKGEIMEREVRTKRIVGGILAMFFAAFFAATLFWHGESSKNYADVLVQKYKPVGAAMVFIEEDGTVRFQNYGYADKENEIPVTEDTKFKIASISKTFTSYAIMQLVDEGRLDLDTPVNEYLTSWKIPESKYDENKVTLRTLLSHTSGLSKSDEEGYTNPLPTVAEAMEQREIHLVRKPGVQFEYSEFVGHGICQLVIEDVTGIKFEDYMKQYVFEPLGMKDTGYENEGENFAVPYAGNGKEVSITPIVMNGGGGVTTTAKDMSLFVKELMRYYEEGSKEMFQVQKNTESQGGVYALGIIPRKLSNGKTVYEHNGTLTGWNAQMAFEPESHNGMVVLTNSDKAYYMTYEMMEKWGEQEIGEKVEDLQIKELHNIFFKLILAVGICTAVYAFFFLHNIRKGKLQKRDDKKYIVRLILCMLLIGIYYFFAYTAIPFSKMFGMENYYLFTFFPKERGWLYIEILVLFGLWILKGTYVKKRMI